MVILAISFPLKSSNKLQAVQSNAVESIDANGNDFDPLNEVDENEQKLLQRAHEMVIVQNRSEILMDAFKRFANFNFQLKFFLFICFFFHAFFRADLNKDSMLTIQELARYINARIRDHIEASIRNNPIQFSEIDRSPRNGLITWDEYYTYFLKQLGHSDEFIEKVDKARHTNLDRKTKERIMKEKAMWNEAARTDTYSLTLDEFLSFRHPGKTMMRNCFESKWQIIGIFS